MFIARLTQLELTNSDVILVLKVNALEYYFFLNAVEFIGFLFFWTAHKPILHLCSFDSQFLSKKNKVPVDFIFVDIQYV